MPIRKGKDWLLLDKEDNSRHKPLQEESTKGRYSAPVLRAYGYRGDAGEQQRKSGGGGGSE